MGSMLHDGRRRGTPGKELQDGSTRGIPNQGRQLRKHEVDQTQVAIPHPRPFADKPLPQFRQTSKIGVDALWEDRQPRLSLRRQIGNHLGILGLSLLRRVILEILRPLRVRRIDTEHQVTPIREKALKGVSVVAGGLKSASH